MSYRRLETHGRYEPVEPPANEASEGERDGGRSVTVFAAGAVVMLIVVFATAMVHAT